MKDKIDLLEEKINAVMALGTTNIGIMVAAHAKQIEELEARIAQLEGNPQVETLSITHNEPKVQVYLKVKLNGEELPIEEIVATESSGQNHFQLGVVNDTPIIISGPAKTY